MSYHAIFYTMKARNQQGLRGEKKEEGEVHLSNTQEGNFTSVTSVTIGSATLCREGGEGEEFLV